jgi:hypothetical protein
MVLEESKAQLWPLPTVANEGLSGRARSLDPDTRQAHGAEHTGDPDRVTILLTATRR